MRLYRICSKKEIDTILNDRGFDNVGTIGSELINNQNDYEFNNHSYKEDRKYLHFFPTLSSVLYLNAVPNRYICTYEIDDTLLEDKVCFGKYLDLINYRYFVLVEEFALDTELLSFDNIESINVINNYMDIEDFLFSEELPLASIYEKDSKVYVKTI